MGKVQSAPGVGHGNSSIFNCSGSTDRTEPKQLVKPCEHSEATQFLHPCDGSLFEILLVRGAAGLFAAAAVTSEAPAAETEGDDGEGMFGDFGDFDLGDWGGDDE